MSVPGFDAFNLAAVVSDLRQTVVGARVQKIQQPVASELILLVYGRSGAQRVIISTDPKSFRIHRTTRKRENPLNPPGFCQLCRKYLEGGFILEVVQPQFDRVVELVFTSASGGKLRLIAELMGRNANLILVSDAGSVLGVMRPMPPDSPRPLRTGSPYLPPPGYRERVDPSELNGQTDPIFKELPTNASDVAKWLMETFSGMSKFAAEEVLSRSADNNASVGLLELMDAVKEGQFNPHDIQDEEGTSIAVWSLKPSSLPTALIYPRENISTTLDALYAEKEEESAESVERNALRRILDQEIAFRRKELAAAQATLKEAERAEEYERIGNNLLANLSLVEKGQSHVTIPDLYSESGESISVVLDPKRIPQENAEAYFTRSRKARDSAEYATGQVADRTHEIVLLMRLSERLGEVGIDDFASIRLELTDIVGTARTTPKTEQKAAPKPFGGYRIRTFTIGEYTLLVGETAEANDHLTTRIASPTDWWFHVRSAPGAHGVLRAQGKPDRVPDTVIRRAAQIVAARSGTAVKHAGVVAVDVVEKRYVRKPRSAKPGLVTYERERTLDVEPVL